MARLFKLVEKFILQPQLIDFGDVETLLSEFGYTMRKRPGSERTFHKPGFPPVNVPTVKGKGVKLPYVKRLIRLLELEEWYGDHKEA